MVIKLIVYQDDLYNFLTTGTLALTSAGLSLGGIVVAIIGAIIALFIYYAATRSNVY